MKYSSSCAITVPNLIRLRGRDPARTNEATIGGWGIQLVRRYMDEIRYEREAGENVLRLSKRLGPEGGATEFQKSQTKQSKTKNGKSYVT